MAHYAKLVAVIKKKKPKSDTTVAKDSIMKAFGMSEAGAAEKEPEEKKKKKKKKQAEGKSLSDMIRDSLKRRMGK